MNKIKLLQFGFIFSILSNLILIAGLTYLVHRLGGIKFMLHRINNNGLAGTYENRINLFNHLGLSEGSIIFLGDSLTEFGQWEELMDNPKVKNRGIAGDTTWGLLRRLKGITDSKPLAIFLMIGINDFLFTEEAEIVKNYREIIQRIKTETPNTKLFIQSVLPINSTVKKTVFDNSEITSLNSKLQQLAKENDLEFINIHPKLLDNNQQLADKYTADGVHINGIAYNIWKETVTPYLLELNAQNQ